MSWYWPVRSLREAVVPPVDLSSRPPMTGGQNTIQGARDVLLHHPLALPSDVRLLSYCELYVLLGKYVELMPLSENVAPSVQVLQTVKEACMSFDKWYYEWVEIMSGL